jgi:hypothetical protein
MPRKRTQANPGPVSLRLADELRQAVEQAALEDERSLHGELVWLLKLGLQVRAAQAKALADSVSVRPPAPCA